MPDVSILPASDRRMASYRTVAAGGAALVALVFAQNLFGRELNAFFLKMPGIDKVLHFLEYVLVVVGVHALPRRVISDAGTRVRVAVIAGVLLASLDESVQLLVPTRSVEVLDLIANVAGVLLGWVLVRRPRPSLAAAAAAVAFCAAGYATWTTHVKLADYSRALQYERQHDFVRAREHYRRALEAGMRTPSLFNELAWVEVESGVGDPRQAVEYARRALEMQPGNPDILDTYGWALHHAGRHADALDPLQQAYRKKPDIYCIHYHLGAVYLALARPAEASEHFRKQVALTGTREAALASQALSRMNRGQH
jgi:Tfp pilus assembly protein PilF